NRSPRAGRPSPNAATPCARADARCGIRRATSTSRPPPLVMSGGPMRSTRLARVLAALLPPRARRDLFEPALCDLDAQRHGRRANAARLILLFLDCWRVAPAEILSMFLKDLRHAFRLLRRDALFTATV